MKQCVKDADKSVAIKLSTPVCLQSKTRNCDNQQESYLIQPCKEEQATLATECLRRQKLELNPPKNSYYHFTCTDLKLITNYQKTCRARGYLDRDCVQAFDDTSEACAKSFPAKWEGERSKNADYS